MKVILVVLLVIGVVSAVPVNPIRLQDLLTQPNSHRILQQNHDLYQPSIATYPGQYHLISEWLAAHGFALPRLGSIQSRLRNSNGDSILDQFSEGFNEIWQQFLGPVVNEFIIFAVSNPVETGAIVNILTSFSGSLASVDYTDDTSELQFFIQLPFSAFQWIFAHPNEVQQVTDFLNGFFSVDEFSSSLANLYLSNFASLITEHAGSLNLQQLFPQVFESFDFEELVSPEFVYEILIYSITNPDNGAILLNFLTSLGINYVNLVDQLLTDTFDPEQFITPGIGAAVYQWILGNPNCVKDLGNFFFGFIQSKSNDPNNPISSSVNKALANVLAYFVPNFLLDILG